MEGSANHRYQVLDSLRGIAACMVVMFHFHTVGWISNLAFVRNGWMFVDFFFVLSGFVVTTAYRRRIADGFPIGSFMWLRMGRIYPVHLVVLSIFLAFQLILLVTFGSGRAFHNDMSLGRLLASLTLTQTIFVRYGVSWNGPSWSIAAEMWTYLIFAALFRIGSSRKSMLALSAIVAAASFGYLALFNGGSIFDINTGAIFRCLYGFAFGVIGAELFPLIRGKWRSLATGIEIVALGVSVTFITIIGNGPMSMLSPPMFLAVILIFANQGGVISSGLKMKFPLFLGKLSYSIYMVHLLLLYRLSGLIDVLHKGPSHSYLMCSVDHACTATGSPVLADALIVPVLIGVIGAAFLLHHFVEVPCERWARSVLSRRVSRAAPSAWSDNPASE